MSYKNLNAKNWSSSGLQSYAWAFLGVAIAFSTRYTLHPFLGDSLPLFFFQINTIVIAFNFGLLPSILSFALSLPLIAYFFLAPFNAFDVVETGDIRIVVVYATYTVLTGLLIEKLRREQYSNRLNLLVSNTRLKYIMESKT